MKTHPSSPEINETQLLEVLASLNQISDAINHIGPGDASNSGVSLQLIVESAIRVVPGSSAVIHTYDQATGTFEAGSRVSAQAEGRALSTDPVFSDDAPRPNGMGCAPFSADGELYPMKSTMWMCIHITRFWV